MKNSKWLFALLTLILTSCSSSDKKPEAVLKPAAVTAMDVQSDIITESFKALGEIEVYDSVELHSKVKGKLVNYCVKKGDLVQKGDTVAHIDRDEIGFKYQTAPVLSTITGTVAEVSLGRGSEVHPDTVVALIISLDEVKAVMHVSERHFGDVKLGQKARVFVAAYPNQTFIGTISEISPIMDTNTRTFPIGIVISNQKTMLLPGMFAKADIILKEIAQAIVLPEEAVISSSAGFFVYKLMDDKAVEQSVTIGKRVPGKVQILSGVDCGDKIVLTGHQKITNGSDVMILGGIKE